MVVLNLNSYIVYYCQTPNVSTTIDVLQVFRIKSVKWISAVGVIILSLICFGIAWYCIKTNHIRPNQNYGMLNNTKNNRAIVIEEKRNASIRILAWTMERGKRWSSNDVLGGKCEFIDNILDVYNTSDVVIFKARMLLDGIPSYRPPGQRWIYYEWESATHTMLKRYAKENDLEAVNYFNYSLTYSRTSSIFMPYGECIELSKRPVNINKAISEIVNKKTRLVAWMVSNCFTTGGREKYVRELQKYIPVDIYGNCGTFSCYDDRDCEKHLTGYKFYLAFENSVCGEYITEKLWRSFAWGLVPVVYGGLDGYKQALPPHSYIDVSDFSSPEKLSSYILQVHANKTLYRNYFAWKTKFHCGILNKTAKLERICSHLHNSMSNVTVDTKDIWNHKSVQCMEEKHYLTEHGVTDFSKVNVTVKQGGFKPNKN